MDKKRWYVFLSHKKNEMMPFSAICMNLEIIIYEVSQTEKGKYNIACMQNLKKNDTNKFIYKTETGSQTRGWTYVTVVCGKIDWEWK